MEWIQKEDELKLNKSLQNLQLKLLILEANQTQGDCGILNSCIM